MEDDVPCVGFVVGVHYHGVDCFDEYLPELFFGVFFRAHGLSKANIMCEVAFPVYSSERRKENKVLMQVCCKTKLF